MRKKLIRLLRLKAVALLPYGKQLWTRALPALQTPKLQLPCMVLKQAHIVKRPIFSLRAPIIKETLLVIDEMHLRPGKLHRAGNLPQHFDHSRIQRARRDNQLRKRDLRSKTPRQRHHLFQKHGKQIRQRVKLCAHLHLLAPACPLKQALLTVSQPCFRNAARLFAVSPPSLIAL